MWTLIPPSSKNGWTIPLKQSLLTFRISLKNKTLTLEAPQKYWHDSGMQKQFIRFFAFFISFTALNFSWAQTPSPTSAPATGQPKTDLLFIVDSSGSMAATLEGQRMIDWAKKAVKSAASKLPAEATAGLRLYAHRIDKSNREASCKDTELVVPMSTGTGGLIAAGVDKLEPRGWTPIAYSLEQAELDFNGNAERLHTIILVSDGEETCGGDPAAVMRALVAKGFKMKLCTVGFNVEPIARQQLEALASEFGCSYTDVRSGASLEDALGKLTQQTFLIDKKDVDNRVRGGDNYATAVPLEVGKRYRLDHHQRKGQFDYFSLPLNAGQSASIHMYPVEKCIQIVGEQTKETQNSFCDPEAFHMTLLDKDQKEIAEVSDRGTYTPEKSAPKELVQAAPYYLIVGSPLADMHRDNEFMVEVTNFGDANTDKDAGATLATAISLTPGIYETNRITGLDQTDIFKISLSGPSLVKIVATNIKEENFGSNLQFEVIDELGAVLKSEEISENESSTYQSATVLSGAIYIRLKLGYFQYDSSRIYYSLGVSVTPSTVAVTTPPPTPAATPAVASPSPRKESPPVVEVKTEISTLSRITSPWFLWPLGMALFFFLTTVILILVLVKKRKG